MQRNSPGFLYEPDNRFYQLYDPENPLLPPALSKAAFRVVGFGHVCRDVAYANWEFNGHYLRLREDEKPVKRYELTLGFIYRAVNLSVLADIAEGAFVPDAVNIYSHSCGDDYEQHIFKNLTLRNMRVGVAQPSYQGRNSERVLSVTYGCSYESIQFL